MKLLSIGEVAKRTGLRTSALRYYENCGLLPTADRVAGRRVYSHDVIRRIGLLRFAREAGFTLQEIKTLIHGFEAKTPLSVRWQTLAGKKLAELDELAGRIERMKLMLVRSLKCACVRIEDCTIAASMAQVVDPPAAPPKARR